MRILNGIQKGKIRGKADIYLNHCKEYLNPSKEMEKG